MCVSIPSKRESALQEVETVSVETTNNVFRFPPNGKVLGKFTRANLTKSGLPSFDSLRTGKCFASPLIDRGLRRYRDNVSIPSKRESALQVKHDDQPWGESVVVFRFPPNGKVLCKINPGATQSHPRLMFRFPPNGKVLCKLSRSGSRRCAQLRFDSLRTGKCFARQACDSVHSGGCCFDSLRTGKCFARKASAA